MHQENDLPGDSSEKLILIRLQISCPTTHVATRGWLLWGMEVTLPLECKIYSMLTPSHEKNLPYGQPSWYHWIFHKRQFFCLGGSGLNLSTQALKFSKLHCALLSRRGVVPELASWRGYNIQTTLARAPLFSFEGVWPRAASAEFENVRYLHIKLHQMTFTIIDLPSYELGAQKDIMKRKREEKQEKWNINSKKDIVSAVLTPWWEENFFFLLQ